MPIYFDNAATTRVSDEVLGAMLPYLKEQFANPSSLHFGGINNKKVLNLCRQKVSEILNCQKDEIYFTSSGTEANNWAIKGLAFKAGHKKEIISTKVEHHSVLRSLEFLEKFGFTIHYLSVNEEGFIDLTELESLINPNTLLVSIIYANNEIGTIQDIKAISKLCRKANVYLHTDATQAMCHIEFDINDVDLLTFAPHKFNGPKGIGCLYVKRGIEIEALIHGGQQENDKRAGTENLAYVVGLTKALELSYPKLKDYQKLQELTKVMYNFVKKEIPNCRLNGAKLGSNRLAGNLNLSFKGVDGSLLLYLLNKNGVYCSTGSACDSKTIEPTHVLKAINVPKEYINGSIRISLSLENTLAEAKQASSIIVETVKAILANK